MSDSSKHKNIWILILLIIIGGFIFWLQQAFNKKHFLVFSIVFSPDGKYVSSTGTFKLWNLLTNREIETDVNDHELWSTRKVSFSSEGKRVAVSLINGMIDVRDTNGIRSIAKVTGQKAVLFPDGKKMIFLRENMDKQKYAMILRNLDDNEELTLSLIPKKFVRGDVREAVELFVTKGLKDNDLIVSTIETYADNTINISGNSVLDWEQIVTLLNNQGNDALKRIHSELTSEEKRVLSNMLGHKRFGTDEKRILIKVFNRIIDKKILLAEADSMANRKALNKAFPFCIKSLTPTVIAVIDPKALEGFKFSECKFKNFISSRIYKQSLFFSVSRTGKYSDGMESYEINVNDFSFHRIHSRNSYGRTAFAPLLKRIAYLEKGYLKICDYKENKELCSIKLPEELTNIRDSLVFTPDSKEIAIGYSSYRKNYLMTEGRILIYNAETGKLDKIVKPGVVINKE